MWSLIQSLNDHSPFLWEVRTDGRNYTILCEDGEVHDPESDTYLTDLDMEDCRTWLKDLIRMA